MQPKEVLKKYWGYDEFRFIQEDIISSILSGNDTLALMPTGGGKSLCYQVPALCQPGLCLVISPLIALMQDQVQRLRTLGIDAESIYAGLNYNDIDRILNNCQYGKTKFLYISPERLETEKFKLRLPNLKLNFIAVDEAHCISQWGYDFRPSYKKINEIREITTVPILALTATATPFVQKDIIESLSLKKAKVYSMSFARPNIQFAVEEQENKPDRLVNLYQKIQGTGIVYVRNRKYTELYSNYLNQHKIQADFFHAGLESLVRKNKQEKWLLSNQEVIVSTNAFGMGIDKSNVRLVTHVDIPGSLEEYYQEAGRAGRDNKRSFALLLYNDNDLIRLQDQVEIVFPSIEEIRLVYRKLAISAKLELGESLHDSIDFDIIQFCNSTQLPYEKCRECLRILEQAGWIVLSEGVLIPSRLQISCSRNELAEYENIKENYQKIIHYLLRSYEGIFSLSIPINEAQMASALRIDYHEVVNILQFFHFEQVVRYTPYKEKPQLFFPIERQRTEDIHIDKKWYTQRKKIFIDRINAMIAYVELDTCRQKFILEYFGEKQAKDCGRCDNCLRIKSENSKQSLSTLQEEVIKRIKENNPTTIHHICHQFPLYQRQLVFDILEELIGDEFLKRDLDKIELKNLET